MCIFDESATWKVYCWPILYNTAIAATNPSMYCKHGVHTNAHRIYPGQKGYTTAVFLGEGQCFSEVEEVPMAKPYVLLRIHKSTGLPPKDIKSCISLLARTYLACTYLVLS